MSQDIKLHRKITRMLDLGLLMKTFDKRRSAWIDILIVLTKFRNTTKIGFFDGSDFTKKRSVS